MADNKQYITQVNENGTVLISEDVIATIATQALNDIDGFAGLYTKNSGDFAELLNAKNWGKGIKVSVSEKNALSVTCNVIVVFGFDIVAVSKAIQEAVGNAISSVTGAKVHAVNVNVCGIVRK